MIPRIYVCTTNQGKLADFSLGLTGIALAPLPGLPQIEPPEENGSTFEENAIIKALYYSRFSTEPVLADDSGLVVEALNGAPGIYSARYSAEHASDASNNALLLSNLAGHEDRRARYVCVLALAQSDRLLDTASGAVDGSILSTPRGTGGFGYDPLFFYPPLNRTFAELSNQERFSVSHRGNALRELASILLRR